MTDLKPCPFCGGMPVLKYLDSDDCELTEEIYEDVKAFEQHNQSYEEWLDDVFVNAVLVYCGMCGAYVSHGDKEGAIENWNRRVKE